ncbi:hypothetical protein BV25DRAFT_1922177 [Artomyces pyxidatus]|uniref:Uncharacterized protein n=1 Tax=Artomyces pyxidatus TaxID=48021 RepID=A0ACB8SEY5_9AGAM|nr:hypothetical protein BV25DRAFT_1922177 [Artomyces pyxidatus]
MLTSLSVSSHLPVKKLQHQTDSINTIPDHLISLTDEHAKIRIVKMKVIQDELTSLGCLHLFRHGPPFATATGLVPDLTPPRPRDVLDHKKIWQYVISKEDHETFRAFTSDHELYWKNIFALLLSYRDRKRRDRAVGQPLRFTLPLDGAREDDVQEMSLLASKDACYQCFSSSPRFWNKIINNEDHHYFDKVFTVNRSLAWKNIFAMNLAYHYLAEYGLDMTTTPEFRLAFKKCPPDDYAEGRTPYVRVQFVGLRLVDFRVSEDGQYQWEEDVGPALAVPALSASSAVVPALVVLLLSILWSLTYI